MPYMIAKSSCKKVQESSSASPHSGFNAYVMSVFKDKFAAVGINDDGMVAVDLGGNDVLA